MYRLFQFASFLGAALLFLIQPLLAKQILPWFGGGSAVWSASLLFFQLGLVAGYAYAHVTRRLDPARQAVAHVVLLCVAIASLPLSPPEAWKPPDGEDLVARVLWLLTANAGLAYVALAATAPLLQDWHGRLLRRDANPLPAAAGRPERTYRLYVLSNAGSLAALLSYPTVVEPFLSLPNQHRLWSAGFVVFVATCAACAWAAARSHRRDPGRLDYASGGSSDLEPPRPAPVPTSWLDRTLWVLLPALGSGLLLATTSTLTQDVAAVPLIWIVPLALYLVTYILAFAGWYWRLAAGPAYFAALFFTIYALREATGAPAILQAAALVAAGFTGCWICHGELVRRRPPVDRLTSFYLALSVGGSLGGAFVALAAPAWFDAMRELPLLHLATVAVFAALAAAGVAAPAGTLLRIVAPPAAVALVGFAGATALEADESGTTTVVEAERGDYGVVRVVDEPAQRVRRLYHGRILHGLQFTTPTLETIATTYYTEGSGAELAIRQHPRRVAGEPLRIGVVGLGTGTIAAWAEPRDRLRVFEIDPVVTALSGRHFSFLRFSRAEYEIVPGDARLSLERERASGSGERYDVLVLDAFSGDAIPVHLLTREALGLYSAVLADDGVIVVHVSNRFLDLRPVVRAGAAAHDFEVLEIYRENDGQSRSASNTWMLVTRNRRLADALRPRAREPDPRPDVLWTDDFSSLLAVWRPR